MRVQITLEGDDYAALKALADEEDRTVAGQARHMLRRALKNSQGEARAHEINAALAEGAPLTWVSPDGVITFTITSNTALQDPQSETAHDVHSGLTPDASPPSPPDAATPPRLPPHKDPLPG